MGLPPAKRDAADPFADPLLPLDFHDVPPAHALDELTDSSFSIVLDRRVADKAGVEVSARLANVPLDLAVDVLADTAGLKAVRMKNLLYVTSPENAAKLRPKPR